MGEHRGQTEPLGTLVAAVAVCLAISLYAAALGGALPGTTERALAESTLDRISRSIVEDGRYRAGSLTADRVPHPAGQVVRITIEVDGVAIDRLTVNRVGTPVSAEVPQPPPDEASRRLSVVMTPGNVQIGRLTVEVWP